jgi:hypothetical protein
MFYTTKRMRIWMTIMYILIILMGIFILSFGTVTIFSYIIWGWNFSYGLIYLYRILIEHPLLKKRMLQSNDFKIIEVNSGAYKIEQKIDYFRYTYLKIDARYFEDNDELIFYDVESTKELKGFMGILFGRKLTFSYSGLLRDSQKTDLKFKEEYFNKLSKYIKNNKIEDRKRKLLKINNLN